ncbi:AMP-binding protein [Streptacidiphilus sp. 4-A2]|nr:AMP-binding protein [Streptacidiphilus sp. 4-A2]
MPVLLPPSPELVAVLLAVLKCGAAYAALDTGWPPERMRAIAGLLPGQPAVTGPGAGQGFAGRRLVLAPTAGRPDGAPGAPQPDRPRRDLLRPDLAQRPPAVVAADGAAAMVFFTSGSTGAPKAVLSRTGPPPGCSTAPPSRPSTRARYWHRSPLCPGTPSPWSCGDRC